MQMLLLNLEGMVNDMELKNSIDSANDLLVKMFLASTNKDGVTNQMVKRNIPKFQSAIIIQSMIKGNHIIGHTNQEVYEMYSYCAKEMDIPLLSMIDLSRTLCKYYGFSVVNKRINGKKVRVFESQTEKSKSIGKNIQGAMHYLTNELTPGVVLGCRNSEIYSQYTKWCIDNLKPICSRVTFSRLVCSILDVTVKSVKKDGITIRIYVEKAGADHGDNSSSQKGLG